MKTRKVLQIVDIHRDDAYYRRKDEYIGELIPADAYRESDGFEDGWSSSVVTRLLGSNEVVCFFRAKLKPLVVYDIF